MKQREEKGWEKRSRHILDRFTVYTLDNRHKLLMTLSAHLQCASLGWLVGRWLVDHFPDWWLNGES